MDITSRRYIGSKAKLLDWIFFEIENNTKGKSFFDVFSGTGCVAERALDKYETVIINDILYSNKVIYEAFWSDEKFDLEKINGFIYNYNLLDPNNLPPNYFSENFGNKYFGYNDAKKIGYIREDIEKIRREKKINNREFNIILATLIYSMDKIANTVGHYEAYRKIEIKDNLLYLRIINIKEYKARIKEIYRRDANELVEKKSADIIFLDPPYNSRQYSRFYHVLENLVEWEKPELFGVALKPKAKNMSEYCRHNAPKIFDELITKLDCKYIVVTYNNTYNSKSSSSKNKISFDQILFSLNKRGKTKIFESSHKFFNAGKTEFTNHKEFLFITEVNNEE